jgi:hypothetical protein
MLEQRQEEGLPDDVAMMRYELAQRLKRLFRATLLHEADWARRQRFERSGAGRHTGEDDEYCKGDRDRIVDVAHERAHERAAAEEENERTFVDRLREFEQQRLGSRYRELVRSVLSEQLRDDRSCEPMRQRGPEVRDGVLRSVSRRSRPRSRTNLDRVVREACRWRVAWWLLRAGRRVGCMALGRPGERVAEAVPHAGRALIEENIRRARDQLTEALCALRLLSAERRAVREAVCAVGRGRVRRAWWVRGRSGRGLRGEEIGRR